MRENRWIGAILARCALYALGLGAAFLGLGTLFFGLLMALFLCFAEKNSAYADDGLFLTGILFWLGVWALFMALVGSIGGAIAGFYSPPQEGWFALKSPFFRRVLKGGICGFFGGILVGSATGIFFSIFLMGFVVAVVIFSFGGQIYGLGRGLRFARRAALSLPKESV